MICYNQENYIRTALDSLLCEKVKPYEIIVGDDYSTDKTRQILEEYRVKYPEIIKLILNERNLGIFSNLNNLISRVTGDVISFLSGDDWYKPNLLEKMDNKIIELKLNPNTTSFILLPSTVVHHKDGSEQLLSNDVDIIKRYSAVNLIFQNKLQTRHVGLSRKLFNSWPLFPSDSEEIGPWADRLHHILFAQHIDQMVFMDAEGPVYRLGVGIASRTSLVELNDSYYRALLHIRKHYLSGSLKLNILDAKYLEYIIACWSISQSFRFRNIFQILIISVKILKINLSSSDFILKEFELMLRRIAANIKYKFI